MDYITKSELGWELDRYISYLRQNSDRFPQPTLEFALAPWHYEMRDHRCPHDSWLESILISEVPIDEVGKRRDIVIIAKYIGAYHDCYFTLSYKGVRQYSLLKPPERKGGLSVTGHGDWLVDELRHSERGLVFHEILFSSNAVMLIECEEVEHAWDSRP